MAKVDYSIQRLDDISFADIVKETLCKKHNKAIYYSAFLREDSVLEIRELLEEETDFTAVIGIRNGSTSSQGLRALVDTGVSVFVVDTGSQTTIFHAKSLLLIDEENERAYTVIGSSNFTVGGFHRNIENNVSLELDLTDDSDKKFYDDFLRGYQQLLSFVDAENEDGVNTSNVLKVDNNNLVDDLLSDGRVIDETINRVKISLGKSSIRSKTVKQMKLTPIKKKQNLTKNSKNNDGGIKVNKTSPVLTSTLSGTVSEVWKSKELKERDLTIPSNSRTNSTGSMLMKKGAYDIDQQSYFYNEVFNQLIWSNREGKPTYNYFTEAKFHFIIEGIEYGPYTLTLKYDERTDTKSYQQKQPNVSLSWGEARDIIKNRNLLGKIMTLYKVDGTTDEFLIEITGE